MGETMTFMKTSAVLTAATLALGLTACGPGYMTPDDVRAHLALPSGSVAPDTIGSATDEFFLAQRASETETQAFFFKDDGAAAAAFANGSMSNAVGVSNAASLGDVACAAGLVASLSKFDECSVDEDCEVSVTLNSCVLRVAGDDNARGSIKFRFKNEVEPEFRQSELTLEFQALEFSEAGASAFLEGAVAVEFTEIGDEHVEVILSADVDFQVRGFDRGFFDDDIQERVQIRVALRFTASATEDAQQGRLEILAFVDVDGEQESVVLTFAAESRQIDSDTTLAGATLSVRGTNGAFECTWAAASERLDVDSATYESEGNCVDLETGDTFDWSDRVEVNNS
jgi:hypothetical protein